MNPQNSLPAKAHKPISKPIVVTGIASTVVIGSGAFVLSFSALTDLAVRAGITPEIGWMWPLIVDGMIVAATVAIVALAGREGKEQFYPWILLFFGAVVSTAANAIHAILAVKASNGNVPILVSALVAAMPPVVLLAITHLTVLLVQYARNSAEMEAALAAAEQADGAAAAETATDPAANLADASVAGGVAVLESVLAETVQTKAEAGTPAETPVDEPAEAPAVEEPAAAKPKPAPKRKPRKPAAATAGAAASKPAAASRPAAASAAKPAAARPAAKSTGSTRQLMPELSTVTGVNPLLRAPQAAGPSADTTATTATTASPAEATTALEVPAGPGPRGASQAEAGSEDSPKELVSAQA